MVKFNDNIPDKTAEENADDTISAACKNRYGGNPQNIQGIFGNIAKVVLLIKKLLGTYFK